MKREKNIRSRFPHSVTECMKTLGISYSKRAEFVEMYPPDYSSGIVGRYTSVPDIDSGRTSVITGAHGSELIVEQALKTSKLVHFRGTKQECHAAIKAFLADSANQFYREEHKWFRNYQNKISPTFIP
jgi:hypothetical protein